MKMDSEAIWGDNRDVRLSAVLVAVLMLTMPLILLVDAPDVHGAGSGVSGSGTMDDPYYGDFTDGGWTYLDLEDKYILIGSTLDVYIGMTGSLFTSYISENKDPGLSYYKGDKVSPRESEYYVKGTLTQVADMMIYTMDSVYGSYTSTAKVWTLHVISDIEIVPLEFLSDPLVDGIVTYSGRTTL